ncbi:MAG: LysM peptidoglycan-binding domain-containing protein [Chloroflexota bacterium]|nr:LysM peptidoglycan-binding domain-containing protein [Chloroflexota bacterium]
MSYRSPQLDSSDRRTVSVLLLVLAIIAALGAFNWLKHRNKPMPTTATLTVLSGEATVTRADAGADPPLQEGKKATLQSGDDIQTAPEAKAKLTFASGETVELRGETELTILELYESPISRALVTTLALHKGETLTHIRHMLFKGMRFTIETRVATVQARGTIFECDLLSKNHAYVAVYDGVVNVSMGEQSVDLQANQELDVRLGQPLTPVDLPTSPSPSVESPSPPMDATTGPSQDETLFPAIVTPTRPGDQVQYYTVQQGDTLYSIARQFGVSWKAVWEANRDRLQSPEEIHPGQKLRIPSR